MSCLRFINEFVQFWFYPLISIHTSISALELEGRRYLEIDFNLIMPLIYLFLAPDLKIICGQE
jgi:hypothetical protein